jgi:predicted phage terminase large subunit-like protein
VSAPVKDFHYKDDKLNEEQLFALVAPFALKFNWFVSNGYKPHYYQQLFHAMRSGEGRLLRYRHLAAGRRGGKTLSAAWELLYYCLFPEQFHFDVHGTNDDRPIYAWVLAKDYTLGKAAWDEFRKALKQVGLQHGVEYRMNITNRWFEFANGAFVHFRTADDPESLRGAGLDYLWVDESAFIPDERAWQATRPALADKRGIVTTTTTPWGKNWYWNTFFNDVRGNDLHGHVEFRSIDNPYFPREEWAELLVSMHPMIFKREFMAAFDAMAGRELSGEWLKYYTLAPVEHDDKIAIPRSSEHPEKYDLSMYMGVDPAISIKDTADNFAMALIGVSRDHMNVFLLETFKGHISFPEQIDKIKEWQLKYKPMLIGIEANAYQAALFQSVQRLETLPAVIPIISQGKKFERILAMAPVFRIGKVRIRESMRDFIDEWLDYDSSNKNPHDDLLDAVEIALSTAGALLPELPKVSLFDMEKAKDINELAERDRPGSKWAKTYGIFDEHMGEEW